MSLFEGGGMRGRDEEPPHKPYWAKYHLTEQDGKAVQEILSRYVGELRELDPGVIPDDADRTAYSQQLAKDIDYIESLAKLFD